MKQLRRRHRSIVYQDQYICTSNTRKYIEVLGALCIAAVQTKIVLLLFRKHNVYFKNTAKLLKYLFKVYTEMGSTVYATFFFIHVKKELENKITGRSRRYFIATNIPYTTKVWMSVIGILKSLIANKQQCTRLFKLKWQIQSNFYVKTSKRGKTVMY